MMAGERGQFRRVGRPEPLEAFTPSDRYRLSSRYLFGCILGTLEGPKVRVPEPLGAFGAGMRCFAWLGK
jgi:hypothetical protein